VARITRKELKSDKFALEVEHTFTFFEEHRAEVIRYGAIAAGVLVLVFAFVLYSRHRHTAREEALNQALQVQEAPIGNSNPNALLSFPTEDARDLQAIKQFGEVAGKYSGSAEGQIAEYYLGTIAADQGKMAEAEKHLQVAADSGEAANASLAKLTLAQVYFVNGRAAEGEKLLRSLMDHPTAFVSKEQAALTLARALAKSKPAEARKLLEPLRTIRGDVGQAAITLYGEIPSQ
jgi:predicted negative regulator of RcsB-dependent stress response